MTPSLNATTRFIDKEFIDKLRISNNLVLLEVTAHTNNVSKNDKSGLYIVESYKQFENEAVVLKTGKGKLRNGKEYEMPVKAGDTVYLVNPAKCEWVGRLRDNSNKLIGLVHVEGIDAVLG